MLLFFLILGHFIVYIQTLLYTIVTFLLAVFTEDIFSFFFFLNIPCEFLCLNNVKLEIFQIK